jgi:hypothetical protein
MTSQDDRTCDSHLRLIAANPTYLNGQNELTQRLLTAANQDKAVDAHARIKDSTRGMA